MNSEATTIGGGKAGGLIGSTIDDKYRIESKLGEGGMGAVYCATRLLIGDMVAIKVLHTEQETDLQAMERFRREAQAAARLKHPNVVTIHDFGVTNKKLIYLVMELVEGESLRSIIRKQGPFTPSATAEIISQVCAALEEAHNRNIVHRDLKPDNIIVTASSSGLRVKVLDFGIAKLRDLPITADSLTKTGTVIGTPHYMSPEQCMGEEIDGRSDIYSLGIVLYEMLSGVVPFNSPSLTALIMQQVSQTPPSLRAINISIPVAVERVVMWALEKRPEARPQTADALAQELRKAINSEVNARSTVRQQGKTNPAPPISTSGGASAGLAPTMPGGFSSPHAAVTPTVKPNKRFVPLLIVGVVILLSALGVIAWLLLPRDDKVSKDEKVTKENAPSTTATAPSSTATAPSSTATTSSVTAAATSVTATASSTRASFRGIGYQPEKALDGSMMTAWVEGVKGPGIGEWIRFDFGKEVKLRRIFIAPGYFKSPQIWQKNNRIAVVVFYFSDGNSRELRFPDRMEEQKIEVGGIRTNWVRIEIKQVYTGLTDSEDTAISQITFEWES